MSEETTPKPAGEIHYKKNERTCVCPVELEPGKDYVVWINTGRFKNFKDKEGRSAVPIYCISVPKNNASLEALEENFTP